MLIKLIFQPLRQLKAGFVALEKEGNIDRKNHLVSCSRMRAGLPKIGLVHEASVVNMNVSGRLELDVLVKCGALQQVDREQIVQGRGEVQG